MKALKNYSEQIAKIKSNLLAEIKRFFIENPNVVIDVEEISGDSMVVNGDCPVNSISSNGVTDTTAEFSDADYDFDVLYIDDLEEIVSILNVYIVTEEKTMKRCEN